MLFGTYIARNCDRVEKRAGGCQERGETVPTIQSQELRKDLHGSQRDSEEQTSGQLRGGDNSDSEGTVSRE